MAWFVPRVSAIRHLQSDIRYSYASRWGGQVAVIGQREEAGYDEDSG